MPAKVFLKVVKGPLKSAVYRFDEQILCLVGRSNDCVLQLTESAAEGVSRHHCMLDIRPPLAFICDLDSHNGTFVNGKRISGTKDDVSSPEATSHVKSLANGDHIRIGKNIFKISLIPAKRCCVCGKELPDDESDTRNSERLVCPDCMAQGRIPNPLTPSSKTVQFRICSVCGARIANTEIDGGSIWEENHSSYICRDCTQKAQPGKTFPMPRIHNKTGHTFLSIPNYRVIRQIGRGGMGAVYLAENVNTLEKTALKILLPEIANQEQCREDFIREANNLKNLRHPNIIELKECDYVGGALFLALEYCTEGTLRECILRNGQPFSLPIALDFTCEILDALEFAHNIRMEQVSLFDARTYTVNGIVHRDIKPENIFLTRQDGVLVAKISDFGLAKAFDMAGISGCTNTGDFSGTLSFISKQQFLNYKYAKPEIDVWAVAATLYYMLTTYPPREFENSREIMRIFDSPPRPVRERNPDIPAPIAEIIDTALNDRERLYYRTADQFKFALISARNQIYL